MKTVQGVEFIVIRYMTLDFLSAVVRNESEIRFFPIRTFVLGGIDGSSARILRGGYDSSTSDHPDKEKHGKKCYPQRAVPGLHGIPPSPIKLSG